MLQLNNASGRDGGAETVTALTAELLEEGGHEVVTLHARAGRSRAGVYSVGARRAVACAVRATRPDVAHAHNVYGQLTLSVLDALHAAAVPMVVTLHDYRAVCANGILLAPDGQCTRCLDASPAHAVRLACLHGSRSGSAVAALEMALNQRRGTYAKADVIIAPSRTLGDIMTRARLGAGPVELVPNAVRAAPAPRARPPAAARFVFAGRLTAAKGLHTLLSAARELPPGARVVVIGGGRLEAELRCRARGLPVDVLGVLSAEDVSRELSRATAAVVPSRWLENCPMIILEAGAVGVPAVASDLGGMRELICHGRDGLLVAPGDPVALGRALRSLAADPALVARLGVEAWHRVCRHHSPVDYRQAILSCYERARARRGAPTRGW